MLEKNYRILLSVIILLFVAGIYYGSGSEEERQQKRMLAAVSDHDHEAAIINASEILKKQPTNSRAKRIIQDSSQIFAYLQTARSTLSDFESEDPEKLFERFNTAKKFSSKAKALDPYFSTSKDFDEALDKAQRDLIYILAMNVIEVGESAITEANLKYQSTSEIVDSAASSRYLATLLSVQSAWAPVDASTDQIREEIAPRLQKMENTRKLVLDSNGGATKDFSKLFLTYVETTNQTANGLLSPTGSYATFIKASDNAVSKYQMAKNELSSAIPRAAKNKSVSNLVNEIADYQIFQNKSTEQIIIDYKSS